MEELFENGVVVKLDGTKAQIALSKNENCEECSANLFCSTTPENRKIVEVENSANASLGDNVVISVKGKSIFKASVLIYLIPLVILMVSIIGSSFFFNGIEFSEVYSFFLAIMLMGLYYLAIYIFSPKMNFKSSMPKITQIK